MLTRTPQDWYNHTRDIYRCFVQDYNIVMFARFRCVSNTASSKRLNMSWTTFPTQSPLRTVLPVPYLARRELPHLPSWKTRLTATAKIRGEYSPLQSYKEKSNEGKEFAIILHDLAKIIRYFRIIYVLCRQKHYKTQYNFHKNCQTLELYFIIYVARFCL